MKLKTNKRIAFLETMFVLLFLSGCKQISPNEYAQFTPLDEKKRIMNRVKLTWEVRDDAVTYCQRVQQDYQRDAAMTVAACSIWSRSTNECTIVTTPNPDHVVIGHEVRHCFEGHFH
ncbi:hypothetical protein [Limnohabitans sp.]|jgi:hypothetical protein|uniref:hypothetical protein n=1 Tax=Limnohabitans sp. TaxID=1907725 RepID=UPI00286EE07F|nr:hypothetical protein [Limnohabitans sp.]